jgi:ABC-type transport system substrate-binding protein/tetratricopeptide (TPR) repeat protein
MSGQFLCCNSSLLNSTLRCCRQIAALLVLLLVCLRTLASADEKVTRTELPRLSELPIPEADALLRADADDKEFDWVVLKATDEADRRVAVVNPIFPRPDTLAKQDAEYKKLENSRPQNAKEREQRATRLKSLKRLIFTLPGDLTEYAVPVEQVDQILYFEDLMLLRVDKLLEANDFRTAYELLLRVETEIPSWDKSIPRFERLLMVEAAQRAESGEIYAALALLEEVFQRNNKNPELPDRVGAIVSPMIDAAINAEDFRKAHYLIDRIKKLFPEHPTALAASNKLLQSSNALLDTAAADFSARRFSKAAELARRAELISPTEGNSRAAYTQYFSRHQTLRVGINEFSGQGVHPAPLEYRERLRELVEADLFEPSSADELTYFRSGFFEIWDPTDLGREVVFTLRETRPAWQSQPLFSAASVADAIGHRINEESPLYSSRLASFISEVSVRSPSQLRIRFSRVPLSIESLLRFPVTSNTAPAPATEPSGNPQAAPGTTATVAATATATDSAAPATAPQPNSPVVVSTRFKQTLATEQDTRWERTVPEPDGFDSGKYHVAEIHERRFADRSNMIQAFIRGDIDCIPHLLPTEIDSFKASAHQVIPYALPMTHVIVFNPLSERITNAQLRRALSFAVNRDGILRSTVLQDSEARHGRPTSAAWNLRSYATEPRQQPPAFNLRLAYALRFAAESQLKIAELTKLTDAARAEAAKNKINFDSEDFRKKTKVDYIKLPRLRFVVEPDPVATAAAQRIVTYWQKIGFEIDVIPGDRPGQPLPDSEWDLCYRKVRMEEPLFELWPVLTNDPTLDMKRLQLFPDWMRQELVGLDYAASFVDAQEKLFRIHNHIAAQAFLIPLWEVDDYAVFRKNISGIPPKLMSTYHNVERWIIRP